jgi:Tol biopolymer transport system component
VTGLIAYLRLANSSAPAIVADIAPPKDTQFDLLAAGAPALSPDGRVLAFAARSTAGTTMLWVRPLDGSAARSLPGTEDCGGPFWSPDGRRIGFVAHRKLQAIEVSGGRPVILSDALAVRDGTWGGEGTVLFVSGQGISQVAASGGAAVTVIQKNSPKYSFYFSPHFLPDGKHFVYGASYPGSVDTFFASLDGKENRLLLQGVAAPPTPAAPCSTVAVRLW